MSHGSIESGADFWCSACRKGGKTITHIRNHEAGAVKPQPVSAKAARRLARRQEAELLTSVSAAVKARLGLV